MKHYDSIVIGAGQAGLAAGFYLRRASLDFVLLESAAVGDSWAQRWDSLRLFTPARYNALPGMPFPGRPYDLPGKDDVARYLRAYAARFALPVRENLDVAALRRRGSGYVLHARDGETLTASSVIVATGTNHRPYVPALSHSIAPHIVQIHSSGYRRPSQLPSGRVLVVGAGNSGGQIALELANAGREVLLSGPDVGALPRRLLGRDIYDWIWPTVLRASVDTMRGRRRQTHRFAADPLIGIPAASFAHAGVRRVGRVESVSCGVPRLDDGASAGELSAIVWCTGFRPDHSWIELPAFGLDGYPVHRSGLAVDVPGLAFLGLRYQRRRRSPLLGGVGEDAEYVVRQIAVHVKAVTVQGRTSAERAPPRTT